MDIYNTIYAADTGVHSSQPYWLNASERSKHVLILGSAPQYKHALQWNMMLQDITAGAGVAVIDGSGTFAPELLRHLPGARARQCLFFQPHDRLHSVGFNPFKNVPVAARPRAAQELMDLFRVIWELSYERTPLLLDILRATARVLLDNPHSSMLSMYRVLTEAEFRKRAVARCADPIARRFWAEFEQWDERDKRDKPAPVLTRLRAFLSDPNLRNSLGQPRAPLDVDRVVSENQVFIADLAAGELGSETSMLFGCLLAFRFRVAMSKMASERPFYLHIPNAHRFSSLLCARLFELDAPLRGVTMSVDQIGGEDAEARSALLRAETLLAFRVGADDTRYLAPRFPVTKPDETLITLPPHHMASTTHQQELEALPLWQQRNRYRSAVIRRSRRDIAVRRTVIEPKIQRFFDPSRSRLTEDEQGNLSWWS